MDEKKKLTEEELDQVAGGEDNSEVIYLYRCTVCGNSFVALMEPDHCPVPTCKADRLDKNGKSIFERYIGDNDRC